MSVREQCFSATFKFPVLSKLAMACLVLPASNADSERIFSHVKKIHTEFRSELSVDTTTDMLATKQNQTVMCCDYEPTENVLQKAKKATMQYNLQHKLKVVDKKL